MVEEVRMVTKFDENDVEPTSEQTIEKDVIVGYAKYEGQVIGVLNLEKVLYDYHVLS